ncbi:hypothetical protein DFQ08_10282 [Winogradskyella arenosi]|uniref:Uncharacterized protein n=1 Tax=Winogradskyella arenosi TaxID=533325 RepID=A0A368ZF17_9FLAO|nr:hypothetical protein DFQ08_10282 [Winogradskyella arenosi]
MYKFLAILSFYKSFATWSFIVTIFIALFTPQLIPATCIKFFLILFAWYYTSETSEKRKLTLYKNLGISSLTLFSTLFIVDLILTFLFLTLFTEFV